MRVQEYGGPEALQAEEVALPQPGPGEARVRIAAVGVNFIDVYGRSGQYKLALPATLGQEAAGTVDAVGEGVTDLQPGDRVAYASVPGSYAEYAVVAAARLVRVPDAVDLKVAAAVMLQGMTAHYLSHSTYTLKQGDTALVHAAAGGAGRLLVQLAKRRGARVFGTAGNPEKVALAESAGADAVIPYTQTDFAAEVRRLTDGRGVDVVYDSVGKDTFNGSLDSLRPRGMLVLYGQSSGAVPPLDPQVLNAKGSLFLTRPTLGHYIATRDELLERSGELFAAIQAGHLDVRIDQTFPLRAAAEAHRYLEARQTKGKVLLLPE
jgi:NADPH2:quinone reductase